MDFSGIIGGVLSGASGGIFGILGGLGKYWMQSRHEDKMAKNKLELTKINNAQDLALMDKEAERASQEAQIAYDKLDLSNLGESVKAQDKEISALKPALKRAAPWVSTVAAFLFTIATFVGKMIRPMLTVALMWITFNLYTKV